MMNKKLYLAFIREEECIGCTKCIQACPVDAIIGSAKQLHTVLNDECIGCQLCVEPCPVDCIDLISVDALHYDRERAKTRHKARKLRLEKNKVQRKNELQTYTFETQRDYIAAAVERVKAKTPLQRGRC